MSDYVYNFDDSALDRFENCLENRLGDGSGHHEQEFFDTLDLLLAVNRNGSCLDVGAGVGRVTRAAAQVVSRVVALEPDESRWRECHRDFHTPPSCQVLCQTTGEYLADNTGAHFDLIVVSMVIQHLSTRNCSQLIGEVAQLLSPAGTAIISTTHTLEQCKGFSFTGDSQHAYIDRAEFDRYADTPSSEQTMGLPVRRFSQQDLYDEVRAAGMEPVFWRQTSYYRRDCVPFFASRLQVAREELQDVGNTQFVVVQKQL